MVKQHFDYSVSVTVLLSLEEVSNVVKVGLSNYDSVCQQLAKVWKFALEDMQANGKKETKKTLRSRDVDIICKIMEQERYFGVNDSPKWLGVLKAVHNEYERINAHWMILDKETLTELYRTELQAKYGDGKVTIA